MDKACYKLAEVFTQRMAKSDPQDLHQSYDAGIYRLPSSAVSKCLAILLYFCRFKESSPVPGI